jgi:predicted AlkP superfamily phosphohydrolase/phosphomutase
MSDAATKVLAIGLDGADRRLLLRYTEDGTMPHLADLRRSGGWCDLATPRGFGDDAVWGSFATGVCPAEHARFYYEAIVPGSYVTQYKDPSWLRREPFWAALARAGRRVAIFDAPKCSLSTEAGVTQVVDWRCHGRSGQPASNPPQLVGELIARFGEDATDRYETTDEPCSKRPLDGSKVGAFLAILRESIQRKREATQWLLDQGSWDLFVTVFKESHCIGHQCWDTGLLRGDAGELGRGLAVREIYRALDEAVGALRRRAGTGARLMVFSHLGMDANYSGQHLLDEVLVRLEPQLSPYRSWVGRTIERVRRVRAKIDDAEALARSVRVAYQVGHNEMSSAIRINLYGREPCGRVRPGAESKAVCETLERELHALVDPDDGRPIVEDVLRCGHAYRGANEDKLPDLLVVWRRDAPIRRAASATVGTIDITAPDIRPGNHVGGGILFGTTGEGEAGLHFPDADILDLAPTLAAQVRVELDAVEGRVIPGFKPEWR